MPDEKKPLEDRILEAWSIGVPAPRIADDEGITFKKTYRVIESARREGDPRAVRRNRRGNCVRVGLTEVAVIRAIQREARRRKITPQALVVLIMSVVVGDGLIEAILDDEDDRASARERVDEVRSREIIE